MVSIMAFASEQDNPWFVTNSLSLQSRYDEESDQLTFVFHTKTNAPSSDGPVRFSGTMTNASAYFGSGGVETRLLLRNQEYALRFSDFLGQPLNLTTNVGFDRRFS